MSFKAWYLTILLLWLLTSVALGVLNAPLVTAVTPHGIVSFEFCGLLDNCEAAMSAWGETGQVHLALIQGLDYLYLVLYPALLGFSLHWLTRTEPTAHPQTRQRILTLCIAIALSDALENYALIQILLHGAQPPFPLLSSAAAIAKFAGLTLGSLWLMHCGLRRFLQRDRG